MNPNFLNVKYMDDILFYIIIVLLLIIFYKETGKNYKDENFINVPHDVSVFYDDVKLLWKYKNRKMKKLVNNNKTKNKNLKYKIAFITYENRDKDYVRLHNENMKIYCDNNGYDYYFYSKNDTNISTYWYKIFLVYNLINTNKYDYVFWLDSDTIIKNMKIDLSKDVLSEYSSDIFFGSDNHKIYDITNAGLFIIKNSPIGRQYLKDLIDSYYNILPKCLKDDGKLRGSWAMSCYEQGMMNDLLFEKYMNYTTILPNSIFFNYYICDNNTFIMHLYGSSDNERKTCFSNNM